MTGTVHRVISWAILSGLLIGGAVFATVEVLGAHQRSRLATASLELEAAATRRAAARLPALQAEVARLEHPEGDQGLYWPGAAPKTALLDMQEDMAALMRRAGLLVEEIDRPGSDTPAEMRLDVRANGTLKAVQTALLLIENHDPVVVMPSLRLEPQRGAAVRPAAFQIRMTLLALHQSAQE